MTVLFATPQPNDAAELRRLFAAIRDEIASFDQFREFEERLLQDIQALDYFVRFMQLHVLLEEKLAFAQPHKEYTHPPVGHNDATTLGLIESPALPRLFNTLWHGTVGYLPEDAPRACLVATFVLGVGIFIASLIPISTPTQIATPSPSFTSSKSTVKPQMEFVGRITGMVDCKWADVSTAAINGANAPLGRKYALASGLMEITHDTGAKVILQGPVAYEVESKSGGFLSIGKLTGKVEGKTAKGFIVRTPTATVTDLGTEFGVEVSQNGATESHVFRGAVCVEMRSDFISDQKADRVVVIRENESVRVEKSPPGGGLRLTLLHKPREPMQFVRNLPPPKKLSQVRVLAHFRMGEDDPDAVAGKLVGEQTVNHGHRYHLKRYGSLTYTADAASGSKLAVNFSGTEGEYFYTRYLCWSLDEDFILEAWVRPNRATGPHMYVMYNGRGWTDGYGLALLRGQWYCLRGGTADSWVASGVQCEIAKWVHLALVHDQGNLQLWVNGRLAKEFGNQSDVVRPSGAFTIGGMPKEIGDTPNAFDGQIDEVRLSGFHGPFNPKMLLFPQSLNTK